jgi:hypothetical protein
MLTPRPRRIFGILALAAGILLLMLELDSRRRGGELSWFWLAVASAALLLGLFDITAKPK